jgi:DNA-binding transcriptional MerR regulator
VEILAKSDVADRAGVEPDYVDRLVSLGVVTPDENGLFTAGAARATRVIRDLERGGLPLDGIAEAVKARLIDFGLFDLGNWRGALRRTSRPRDSRDRTMGTPPSPEPS